MRAPTIAERLAANIHAAMAAAPAPEVVHAVERVLLDSLACALGADRSPAVEAGRRWATKIGGTPAATILGNGQRTSVLGAAMVNGMMVRDLDLNDTYFSVNPAHASDNIGACLAVGEVEQSSPMDVVRSILVAFEVQMRCCEFTRTSFFKTIGWDQTTLVTLASAAAAGVLLKLDAQQLAHAIAIAGCYPTIGEVRVGQMSMLKGASAGLAASRGVEAAYLAQAGMTGPREIFEDQRALSRQVLGECDWDVLTAPMDDWRLPRTCLKRYPAAYIIHSSIDATLSLVKEFGITPDRVRKVRVDAFGWLIEDMVRGMGGISRYDIDARETADHSLPYCVAVSLVDGRYDIAQLLAERWNDADVKAMLAKVECVHDQAMDARFPPDRPSRVSIELTDGRTVVREVAYPKGDWRDPLTDQDLARKFASLADGVLDAAQQDRAVSCALHFSRRSVAELVSACCRPD